MGRSNIFHGSLDKPLQPCSLTSDGTYRFHNLKSKIKYYVPKTDHINKHITRRQKQEMKACTGNSSKAGRIGVFS